MRFPLPRRWRIWAGPTTPRDLARDLDLVPAAADRDAVEGKIAALSGSLAAA